MIETVAYMDLQRVRDWCKPSNEVYVKRALEEIIRNFSMIIGLPALRDWEDKYLLIKKSGNADIIRLLAVKLRDFFDLKIKISIQLKS